MTGSTCGSPAASRVIRGQGIGRWYGWWANARVKAATSAWAFAADAAERQRLAAEIRHIPPTEARPFRKSHPWNAKPSA
jgi:hypothetical protein